MSPASCSDLSIGFSRSATVPAPSAVVNASVVEASKRAKCRPTSAVYALVQTGGRSLASRAHDRQRLIEGPVADDEIRGGVADARLAGAGERDEPLRIALEQQLEIARELRL